MAAEILFNLQVPRAAIVHVAVCARELVLFTWVVLTLAFWILVLVTYFF